jgi:DNA invertase Pin-like site-specific DNA recombinase
MNPEASSKVQARHLSRQAFLYVRQSTLRQVFENTESTKRQYALQQRAVALGWRIEQVVVIDSDLGCSGASAVDREGFQRLVTEVGLGRAGIVMGLEVSRLARNSTDWHRLLEICALADCLILDEDGVYDPAHFNDRLLLGLKGTMSEAELHVLRARLRGGILNKARRGELEVRLPIGYIHDPQGRVRLDPDKRIQDSVRQLLQTFERTGSASATVKSFREHGLMFPRHALKGPRHGEILWSELTHSRTLFVLHNPTYAGAFTFGRTRQRKLPDGSTLNKHLPQAEWTTLIRDAHDSYLSWEQYEQNQQRLLDNAMSYNEGRERSAPREGPALLQGLAICAICAARMTVRYHQSNNQLRPIYVCQHAGIEAARPICQSVSGASLDEAVGKLLVAMVTPMTLELALQVQQELESRSVEHDAMRRQEVERARYECDLARRRYMQVDPDNRLVAGSLEAEWNEKLRAHEQAQERYQQQHDNNAAGITQKQRESIINLAKDFPRLWNDPRTPQRERKRMTRLLITDVTVLKGADITAQIRFNGGTTHTLHLELPKRSWESWQTSSEVLSQLDCLLNDHTDSEIACELNALGLRSGKGRAFSPRIVRRICEQYHLPSRFHRMRAQGLLTQREIAQRLQVEPSTVKRWRQAGLLAAHRFGDRGECLFELPDATSPVKHQHQGKTHALAAARGASKQSSPQSDI